MRKDPITLGPRWVRLKCVRVHTAAPGRSVQNRQREEGKKACRPTGLQDPTASVLEDCSSQPTSDQPKIIWDLFFKPLKTLLMLWNTGKESPDTSLWNATSLFTCSLLQCRGESWPRESENPHGSLSPRRLQRWWPRPLEERWLTSRSPCLNSPASQGTAYQISICALHRNRIIHIGKDSI